jgi:hypothetical protein
MKMTILTGKQRSGSGAVCPAAATLTGTSGHDDGRGAGGNSAGPEGGSTPLLNSDGDGAGRCLLGGRQRAVTATLVAAR